MLTMRSEGSDPPAARHGAGATARTGDEREWDDPSSLPLPQRADPGGIGLR